MKKIVGLLIALASTSATYAAGNVPELVLDTVVFQVAAKQWVSTQTALLTVNINATLGNADLVKARADIMQKLAKIADGEWHLIQFDRSQDSSGLEKLSVQAQTRIAQSSLTNIYQSAKAVSKPGATYDIGAVEFKPSLDEVQLIRTQLREKLYQQAQDEVARLNKIYTSQHYSLLSLVFSEGDTMPAPQAKDYATSGVVNTMMVPASAPVLTVSNELVMSALVEVASNRQSQPAS